MQASNEPTKIQLPFANAGDKQTIPVASQIGVADGRASYTDGFPPLTRTPVVAGGVPPFGTDMNGILNAITAIQQWVSAGGTFKYDSAFSTAIGGYPKGAVLQKADSSGSWISTAENNTANPDTGGAGWLSLTTGRLINVQVISASGTFTASAGTTSVVVEAVGGGGAAGGTPATDGSSYSMGACGAAGTYASGRYTSGFNGVAMTIGQGGVGVSGGNGGAGGTTSFGSLLSCPGGPGGSVGTTFASTATSLKAPALGSNPATGANISSSQGARGIFGISTGGSQLTSDGGASFFGPGGGGAGLNLPGNNATNPGSGGSARFSGTGNVASAGGNGANGLIIVWEFA